MDTVFTCSICSWFNRSPVAKAHPLPKTLEYKKQMKIMKEKYNKYAPTKIYTKRQNVFQRCVPR